MEDILLMQVLKKKGYISSEDIHEFHELAAVSEPIYTIGKYKHVGETEAKRLVSHMFHIEDGNKYIGEKFSIQKAVELCAKYKNIISSDITYCDIYLAINAHYHDYITLFKTWFNDDIEYKIIESAMVYWFMDDDYVLGNKIVNYFSK